MEIEWFLLQEEALKLMYTENLQQTEQLQLRLSTEAPQKKKEPETKKEQKRVIILDI